MKVGTASALGRSLSGRLLIGTVVVVTVFGCRAQVVDESTRATIARVERSLGRRPYEARLPSATSQYRRWARNPLQPLFTPEGGARRGRRASASPSDVIAALASGHAAEAVAPLEMLVRTNPQDADLMASLSVGYLGRFDQHGDPRDLPRALDALMRTIRLVGPRADLYFNRALIFQKLGLTKAALQYWTEYELLPDEPQWRNEAQEQRIKGEQRWTERRALNAQEAFSNLSSSGSIDLVTSHPEEARFLVEIDAPAKWGQAVLAGKAAEALRILQAGHDMAERIAAARQNRLGLAIWSTLAKADGAGRAALASGHIRLRAAIEAYDTDLRDQAWIDFEAASPLLHGANDDAWLWAELYLALMETQRRQLPQATRRLEAVRNFAGARPYPSFIARESLLRGVILLNTSGATAAMNEFRTAIALYEACGETADAAVVYNAAADTLNSVGDQTGGWGFVGASLAATDRIGSGFRRYQSYFNAATFSSRDGLDEAALVFQELAIAEARDRGARGVAFIAEGLIRRSILKRRRGDLAAEADDLDEAEALLPSVADERYHFFLMTWLRARRGEALLATAPEVADLLLERTVEGFRVAEPARVPFAWLQRGRAALAMNQPDRAAAAFQTGIREFESQRRRLTEADLRVSSMGDAWTLYQELVGVRALIAGDWSGALELSEDGRSRTLAERREDRPASIDVVTLQQQLGPQSAVVSFFASGDRMLWWVITARQLDSGVLPQSVNDLRARVSAFDQALSSRATPAIDSLLADLHGTLIASTLGAHRPSILVVIPDDALHRVPFAALIDRSTNRHLIQDSGIVMAPSIRVAIATASVIEKRSEFRPHTVAVGQRQSAPRLGLVALPEAVNEARAVAKSYPESSILIDDQATTARLLSTIAEADIVHFAGHAVSHPTYPALSFLLVQPDNESPSGALFAYQLEAIRPIRPRIFVLAACGTANGPSTPGEGPMSFAWPLLRGGASSVVASLWDLDDNSSRILTAALHRHMAGGADPPSALRAAQLELMAKERDVFKWAALVAIGGARLQ